MAQIIACVDMDAFFASVEQRGALPETGAEVIVVGAALDSRGQVGVKARSAHRLVDALRSISTLKIIPWDESHSTQIAAEYRILAGVKRKTRAKPIDALAAAVILQDYLDRRQTEDESA